MFTPEWFGATYYAAIAVIAIPSFGLTIARLIQILRRPAPPDGSQDAKSVFAGLNRTGLKVFLVLLLICWYLCWIPWRFASCRAKRAGMTTDPDRRWIWPSARTRRVMLTIAVLLGTYVGSYAWLSRRGMREARDSGMDGFFYVPTEEIVATQDLRKQLRLVVFYAPVNLVDHAWFGTSSPVTNMMFRFADDDPNDPPK